MRKVHNSLENILIQRAQSWFYEEIGAWNKVTAQSAKIFDYQEKISFNLKNIEGTILRRGRELMKGSLDWIGLDYGLNPISNQFEYEIEICGCQ